MPSRNRKDRVWLLFFSSISRKLKSPANISQSALSSSVRQEFISVPTAGKIIRTSAKETVIPDNTLAPPPSLRWKQTLFPPVSAKQWNFEFSSFRMRILSGFCGAAGFRTLVQTRNQYAFYMLIPLLIFVQNPEKSIQILP